MISTKVTSIILICVFVVRTSSVVKMPVLSLHALPFDIRIIWRHYVSCSLLISDQALFGNSILLKLEHTPARHSFHSYMKSLGNICAKTWFVHWPSHKTRLLFGLSKFSSRITFGIRKEGGTIFRPVWTFYRTFAFRTTTYHQLHAVSTLFQPFLPIETLDFSTDSAPFVSESTWRFELHSFLIPQNLVLISKCLLFTNICPNKYCKFILNYSDMFPC